MGVGFEHDGLGTELRLGEGPGEEVDEEEEGEEEESDVSIQSCYKAARISATVL